MVITLGAIPLSVNQKRRQDAVCASANPYKIHNAWAQEGEMPILKWSRDFEEYLDNRAKLREKYESKNLSLYPWDIIRRLKPEQKKNDILCWNQGSRPSCSCHGAAHAFQYEQLIQIALGADLIYDAVNPIYNFYRGRGGNYAGGLDMLTTSEEINGTGMFPVSSVGDDNISVTRDGLEKLSDASKHQAGIIRIEDDIVDNIFKVCSGLGSIAFASSIYFSSSKEDKNGLRVMSGISSGGHAQAFCCYKVINGTEYIWNQNSHGDRYGRTGNEPESGAWITRDILKQYYNANMEDFGLPMVIYTEGEVNDIC